MTDAQLTYMLSVVMSAVYFCAFLATGNAASVASWFAIAGLGCVTLGVYFNHLYGTRGLVTIEEGMLGVAWNWSLTWHADAASLLTYAAMACGVAALVFRIGA